MPANDHRNSLTSQFEIRNRFRVFGETIRKLTIEGFRCHGQTTVEIASPIMVFSGLNGTGKSTVLQLIAAAYTNPSGKTYSINEFFCKNDLDTEAIAAGAKVRFDFEKEDRSTRPLTLSSPANDARRREWNGQRRRTEKHVYYAGVSEYIPKVEKPYYAYRSRSLTLGDSELVSDRAREWISSILQKQYDSISRTKVTAGGDRTPFITHVKKTISEDGSEKEVSYSEAHMGFGEARTIHMVTSIESLPEKSLILLEEPETSLHPSAQYQFGRYLVDVALEKKHQIFLTTHSEHLQQALPTAGICFLNKAQERSIRPIYGIQPSQSRSLLTDGNVKALTVLVEDPCARAVLRELLREQDADFLKTVEISIGGSCEQIKTSLKGLRDAKLNVAAVLDADQGANPSDNIYALPGTLPPEKEIFQCERFRTHLIEQHELNLDDYMTQLAGVDHHDWFERLANRLSVDEDALTKDGAQHHVQAMTGADKGSLLTNLRNALKF